MSFAPTPIPLGRPTVQAAFYQLLRLKASPSVYQTPADVLAEARNTILSWIREKDQGLGLPSSLELMPPVFNYQEHGTVIRWQHDPEGLQWAARLVHPDNLRGQTPVPGRFWTTDICLWPVDPAALQQGFWLYSRILCASLPNTTAPILLIRPLYLTKLLVNPSLSIWDVNHHLRAEVWRVGFPQQEAFLDYLTAEDRRLPVVVLSATALGDTPEARAQAVATLADYVQALGVVVSLEPELEPVWNELVGSGLEVPPGGLRIYQMGHGIDPSEAAHHIGLPAETLRQMRWFDEYKQREYLGAQAVPRFLKSHLLYSLSEHPLPSQYSRTLIEVQQDCAKMQDLEAMQDIIQQQREALEERQQQIDSLMNQIAVLQDNADQQQERYKALFLSNEILRIFLKEKKVELPSIPRPRKWAEIPQWVDQCFAGRLWLHARAKRELKHEPDFQNLDLVLDALDLLANAYWENRKGLISNTSYLERLQELNLEDRISITDTSAGQHGPNYYINVDGRNEIMDRHLCQGNSFDSRYCLRIYFLWHTKTEQVVVGWLPSHLPNSKT